MSYNLYLDDVREPWQSGNYVYPIDIRHHYRIKEWIIVRNYDSFVNYITEKGLPNLVSFDHDLADIHYDTDSYEESIEKTGYDCAKWLIEYCVKNNKELPEFLVHSANPIGAENIKNILNNFKKQTI